MTAWNPFPNVETSTMRSTKQRAFRTWLLWMTLTTITTNSLRTCSKKTRKHCKRKSACVRNRPGRGRWNWTNNLKISNNPKRKSGGANSTNLTIFRSSPWRKSPLSRKPRGRLYPTMRITNSRTLMSTTKETQICRSTSVLCSTNSQKTGWQIPSSCVNTNN